MTTKKTSSILGLLFSVSLIAVILFAVLNLKQVKAYSQTKFNQYFTFSLCDQPLPYKIGSIDPRFNLTKEKLLTDISKAENIWENEYDGELFEYDSTNKESSLTINLVYDKRTSLNTEINSLQNEVKQKDKNLKSDIDAYKSQVEAYKKRLDEFNNNSDALYKEIQYWNERGGAPEEEYQKLTEKKDQLIKEHDYLKSETERLNQIADSLNLSTDEYNAGIDELNTTIDTFNQTLA